nr:TetR/AcrR family transcriptional regulator [Brachybacterium sacelli]
MRTPRRRWIDEGLKALADGGPDAVRIETLATRLGVTKGGFYGHFTNREALLQEMMEAWEHDVIDDVLRTVDAEGADGPARAVRAGRLTFSPERLPLDLAIREWARKEPSIAERLRRVDDRRMNLLREAFGEHFSDPAEVEARSLLAFSAAIGTHLIIADHGQYTRRDVLARASELLFDPSSSSGA